MALEQAGIQLIAQGVNVYVGDLKDATSATNHFVDTTDKGSGKINAAGEVITGALRHIGTIAVDAFAQAARATVGFLKDSVDLAGDFEAGMLGFQAVAGKDVDTAGLEKFHDLFLQLGKDLPVSTSQVQQAAIEMVKGGIDPATVAAGGLRQNIQFAAAAMDGDLVKAAEISSKIMGGWAGVNATAAEKAAFLTSATDLLTKAANASATDVEGLSLGIFNAQGIARTAGVSFEDLTTTLAALAPRFASSSEAGNSLKNMIARLQPTTIPAQDAMKSLGLLGDEIGNKFYDATGSFVGFEAASQILQDSLVGLNQKQQAAILQTIFGNDAMGAAAALAEIGATGYQHMAEALATANGVVDNAALKQSGFNTSLENAMGSVEALKITLGEKLLPILGDLLDNYIAPAINAISDFAEQILGADDPVKALVKSIDDVLPGFASFVAAVEDGIAALDDLIKWFGTTEAETQQLGGAVDDLGGVWDHLMVVVDNVLDGYMAIAQAVLPIVAGFIDEHGDEISAFFQATWDTIIEIVNLGLELYNSIVPPILQAIAGFIEAHGSEITKVLSGAWEMISSLISGTLDTIKGVLKLALDVIHGDWDAAWKDIQAILNTQVEAIKGIVTGFLDLIAGIFDTTLADILQTWEDNWNMAVDIVTRIDWGQVGRDAVDGILAGLRDNWDRLLGWVSDKAGDIVQAALDAIGASSPAKQWMPVGQYAVQGIMQGFTDTWPALTDLVGSIAGDLVSEMQDIGEQMNSVIADSFGATASIDRQIAKNLDRFKDVLPAYQQYTTGALKQAQDEAQAMLDPAEGARYFKMRSDQILEYAKLQKDLSETQNAEDRARIEQQMLLINRAQTAEISQFQANAQGQQSAAQTLADQVNAIMEALSHIDLTDDQIKIVDMLAGVWSGLQAPISTRAQQYANPPMMQYPSGSGGTTTSSTQTINMPIYTNNSPAALQQSWAIMQASMP